MKTTHTNKLAFAKKDLIELNNSQLNDVNGGSSPVCTGPLIFTITIIIKDMEASN